MATGSCSQHIETCEIYLDKGMLVDRVKCLKKANQEKVFEISLAFYAIFISKSSISFPKLLMK